MSFTKQQKYDDTHPNNKKKLCDIIGSLTLVVRFTLVKRGVAFLTGVTKIWGSFFKRTSFDSAESSKLNQFVWLLALFHVAKNPSQYDLTLYLPLLYKMGLVSLLILVLLILFRDI